jgi:hypothetical protein
MKTIMMTAVILVNVISIAHHARADERRVTSKSATSITVLTRKLPPVPTAFVVTTMSRPAPANDCPTPAFQIVNRADAGCVGGVR